MKGNDKWFVVILCSLLCACVSSVNLDDRETQKKLFKSMFGFRLPDEVKEVRMKDHFVRDSWIVFMKVTYTDKVFARILETNFDEPNESLPKKVVADAREDAYSSYGSKPEWITAPGDSTEVFYGRGRDLEKEGWDKSSEVTWTDEEKHFIYYICSAVDY